VGPRTRVEPPANGFPLSADSSSVDVNYEVGLPERSGLVISTGTPFRLVYGVIHLSPPQENQAFDPHTHASSTPLWVSTFRRHKIHITLWKQLVAYNDLQNLHVKPKFDCNVIVIYLKLLIKLVILFIWLIYIDKHFHVLCRSKTKFWYKIAHFFAWENIMPVDLMFCLDDHVELWPLHRPSSACVHVEPDHFPLHVDVIYGWSLQLCTLLVRS